MTGKCAWVRVWLGCLGEVVFGARPGGREGGGVKGRDEFVWENRGTGWWNKEKGRNTEKK